MIRHIRIKNRAEHIYFVVEILQLIKEARMLFLDLCHVDGISDIWWQAVVGLGLPVGVLGDGAVAVVSMGAMARRVAGYAFNFVMLLISAYEAVLIIVGGRVLRAIEIREKVHTFHRTSILFIRTLLSLIYQEIYEGIILGQRQLS